VKKIPPFIPILIQHADGIDLERRVHSYLKPGRFIGSAKEKIEFQQGSDPDGLVDQGSSFAVPCEPGMTHKGRDRCAHGRYRSPKQCNFFNVNTRYFLCHDIGFTYMDVSD